MAAATLNPRDSVHDFSEGLAAIYCYQVLSLDFELPRFCYQVISIDSHLLSLDSHLRNFGYQQLIHKCQLFNS